MEHLWNDQPPVTIKLFDLAGRKAVVTGASRGIGKTVIEALRANGAFCYGLSNEALESDADCHLNTLAERQSLPKKIHPVDVANHILFYLSEVGRTSTGHNCVVDGIESFLSVLYARLDASKLCCDANIIY